MTAFLPDLALPVLLAALGIGLVAGVVKGMVGFAMPMIMISGLSSLIPPELALAGLILPTLVTNGMQALRQGAGAAWQSVKRFRLFLLVGLVFLLGAAQLVTVLPVRWLLLAIGLPITLFAMLQLAGWQLRLAPGTRPGLEAGIGAFAGFIGGLSGVWGPPTVAYLTAIGTEKTEQMRVQGVI
ncbi:MAG: sulfite exporter TauE/SafE family protein, partial [Sagittula sp.]